MTPRAVLLDIDDVLYVEDEPLPGAIAAVERLRSAGAALRFVTNTTSRSRAATLEKLTRLGFTVASDELITPVALAVRLCRERGYRRVALLVPPDTEAEFAGLETIAGETGADAVIVGDLGEAWNYAALNGAFRLVMDGAALIALQKNRFIGGALAAGLARVLLRTGKYRRDVVLASGIEPTATVDSIADVPAVVGALRSPRR